MIFVIVIGFPEVVWAIVCREGCVGNFHGFPGSFNVVGGDLGSRFSGGLSVSVFLYEFKGVVEVLHRFPGVVRSLIAFPVDQEFMPVVLAAAVMYLLCFPFLGIIDWDACALVYSAGLESIGIFRSLFLNGGNVEVRFLACQSRREM